MDKLEEYIEQLYETGEAKLAATNKILALARNQDNLENLLNDGKRRMCVILMCRNIVWSACKIV